MGASVWEPFARNSSIDFYDQYGTIGMYYVCLGINNIWGERNAYQFKFLDMHMSQLISIQKETYENYIQSIRHSDDINISEQKVGVQISNIIFPTKNTEIDFETNFDNEKIKNLF